MKKHLHEEEEKLMSTEKGNVKKRKKESKVLDVMSLIESPEKGIRGKGSMKQLSNALDDTNATHLVPLEPTHNYILRDFLRTNNMLNQSMSVLNEQNKQNIKDWEGAKDVSKKRDVLDKAVHDTRLNAMALAQVVQAKVQYIKAVKDSGKK